MSDTDDTDILLLIPPDYYISTAEQRLQREKMETDSASALAPPTAAYQYLAPNKKTELNKINARLQNIEIAKNDCQFTAPSDISTISTSTIRTQLGGKNPRNLNGFMHSTPKTGDLLYTNFKRNMNYGADDGILVEIDNYLDENNRHVSNQYDGQRHSDGLCKNTQEQLKSLENAHASSLPGCLNTREIMATANTENKLISLSDLWGKSGQTTAISINKSAQATLNEEKLRRQHLEKTVYTLQTQLLEYQQRLSVAIEVDRTKDTALTQAQQESKSLNYEVQNLRDALHKLENERQDYNSKMDTLQNELAQAVCLATKFQEKNEKLETQIEANLRKCHESCEQHTQALEELQLQLHGSKRAEECANDELHKLKDKYAKIEYQNDKIKAQCAELEKENNTLRHQKEMLQDYHQKQKTRADNLENQKKSLQETLANLTENETTLKKKLEIQQKSLKAHYQQQLENVVAQKLNEFQMQLDKSEEHLKSEARERERLIAERAVKQLEMINEKNNQELRLLQEKYNEEVELYRLQLANASKKIQELEIKLKLYKSKRADIAEQLHNVMETQWKKALEILISPNHSNMLSGAETDAEYPEHNARSYETPKSSKTCKTGVSSNSTEKNNLDVICKKDPPSPMDKLQAYIELLLSKSPSDFEKLDEILALTAKHKANGCKYADKAKKGAHGKPPWKA